MTAPRTCPLVGGSRLRVQANAGVLAVISSFASLFPEYAVP